MYYIHIIHISYLYSLIFRSYIVCRPSLEGRFFRTVSDSAMAPGQIDANDIQDLGKVVLEKGQQGLGHTGHSLAESDV